MRTFLIAVGAVLVLLVAAVLVGPSLVDWNTQKDRIVAEVREATGRDFSIRGDMSLSLLPVPALTAQGVRLASVEGGSDAPMVELKELRVRVAVLPLLGGTVQVERILLVEPRILLEVLPDGRRNWSFDHGSAETAGQGGRSASDFDIRFDDVSIEKGTLIYRDAVSGREERIDELTMRIVAESLHGPFAAKGSVETHGVEGDFEGTLGRLVEEGATPYNVVVKPAGGSARVQLSGAISTHPETVSIHGRLKGEGENLARLIEDLSEAGGPWPTALTQAFAVQGEVSLDSTAVSVSDLALELAGVRLTGDMASALAPPYDARLTLAAAQLDLDRLFESDRAAPAGDRQAGEPAADAAPSPGAWVLPADTNARLELSVDALVFRGQLVRQLRLDAALSDGELQLERASALLPGSSDVSLSGSLRDAEGEAAFTGYLEAASDNLRGLLYWAGADVSAVPPDRLRRMNLSGQVTASAKQIAINDLDLRFDLTRVSGGVVVAPRRRPGLGIGLALDSIDLDAYLPARSDGPDEAEKSGEAEKSDEAEESGGAAGSAAQEGAQEGGEQAGVAAGGGLALLGAFDANLNLRAGVLTLGGAKVKDVEVDATLQQGALDVRTARVGKLGGGEIAYVGRVEALATSPSLDGEVQFSLGEPVRLAPLLGLEPESLLGVPALSGESRVTGDLDNLVVDAQVSGGGGRLGVAGAIKPAAEPVSFDVSLTGRHPDLAALLDLAGHPLPPGSDLGVLDLALRVAGEPARFQVSELKGALGPATLSGGFAVALDGPRPAVSALDVAIEAKSADAGALAGLARLAGVTERRLGELGELGDLGALEMRGRLTGGPHRARLDDLEASLGPLRLSGGVGLSLAGLAPALEDYDLSLAAKDPDLAAAAARFGWGAGIAADAGALDLAARLRGDRDRLQLEDLEGRLGPVELSGRLSADLEGERPAVVAELETGELPLGLLLGGTGEADGAAGAAGAGGRWSEVAIDLGGLRSFDARVDLRSAALTHDALRVERLGLSARLRAGLLDLERLTGTLHGGTLQVTGRVDLREEIAAELAVTAVEVDLGDLLRAQAGFERISGPVYVNGDFTSHGRSEADLVAALAGTAEVSGLLTFRARDDAAAEDQNDADLTGLLSRALGRHPVRLAGSIVAEEGLLYTTDTRLDGQPAYALTEATLDLPGWTLEGVTDIYERSTGQPLISTLAFGGPLDAVDLARLAPPASPAPAPEVEPETAPEQAPEAEPGAAEPAPEAVPAPESVPESAPESGAAPLVSGPDEPEAPAAAPSEAQPEAPAPAPKPAKPSAPQPDDLLKDLLKLGS